VVALILFAALTQLQTVGRSDYYHQASVAALGLAVLATAWSPSTALRHRPGVVTRSANLAIFAFAVVSALSAILFGSLSWFRIERGIASPHEANLIAAAATVRANTDPTDPIFVGLTNHRYTILNDMIVYYLADRAAGTWGTMFNPGVTNTDTTQRRMVAELERSRTPLLVLDARDADAFEPTNESAIAGSQVLDDYIASAYRRACQFGTISVLARIDDRSSITCIAPTDATIVDVITTRY
jgi:hypothetical protein